MQANSGPLRPPVARTLYLSCDALAVPQAQLQVTSTNDAVACPAGRSRTCGSVRGASEIVARQTCNCRATKAGSTGDRNDTARPGVSASQERGDTCTNRRAPSNREDSDAPLRSKNLLQRCRRSRCGCGQCERRTHQDVTKPERMG